MAIITSSATFTIGDAAVAQETVTLQVLPALSAPTGFGRIVHPTLGAFDYAVKPDEWGNLDGDAIIAPVWAASKTLGGGVAALWPGYLKDVVVEERWKQSAAMPVSQLRMLLAIWTNPVDPVIGYVQWYPTYTTSIGFNVLPMDLTVGGNGITLDDLVNYKGEDGSPDGWVDNPVVFTLKLISKVAG